MLRISGRIYTGLTKPRTTDCVLIDAHVHLEGLAQQLTRLMLADARSLDDVLDRVRERAESFPRDRVILGTAWDESDWPEPEVPTREKIDRAAPRHAVILRRVDGHLWVVNSAGA